MDVERRRRGVVVGGPDEDRVPRRAVHAELEIRAPVLLLVIARLPKDRKHVALVSGDEDGVGQQGDEAVSWTAVLNAVKHR